MMSADAEMKTLWNEVYAKAIGAGHPTDLASQLANRAVTTAQKLLGNPNLKSTSN